MQKGFIIFFCLLTINLFGQMADEGPEETYSGFYEIIGFSESALQARSADLIFELLLQSPLPEGMKIPPTILERLDDNQILHLRDAGIYPPSSDNHHAEEMYADAAEIHHYHGNSRPSDEIVARVILAAFFSLVLIVAILGFFRYKTKRAEFELLRAAIENNRDLPMDYITDQQKKRNLKAGILLILLGGGIMISFNLMNGPWPMGVIPVLLGIGLVAFSQLSKLTESYKEYQPEHV